MYVYQSILAPNLKRVSTEARKVPAVKKVLDQIEAFTVRPVPNCRAREILKQDPAIAQ